VAAGALGDARLRDLIPDVLTVLVRRGADFASAEDAVQDALIRAVETWPERAPDDPKGWLITTAWRRFVDVTRSDVARRAREERMAAEPAPGGAATADDTLRLYFLCAHPALTSASAVALTLRAVGGLTTRQIARAYLVPEATMAQRISRAKRIVSGERLDSPGDLHTVLRVLYLVFNEGYGGGRRPLRRGDPPGAATRRDHRRSGGVWITGVVPAPSRTSAGADPRRRQSRPAGRAGSHAVVPGSHC
jgi:predicted RNA polymerase sigma factor